MAHEIETGMYELLPILKRCGEDYIVLGEVRELWRFAG